MLLTEDELFDLIGYRTAKRQIAWLTAHGWVFELNRAGKPKVDREYYRSKMGNSTAQAVAIEPNWAAL